MHVQFALVCDHANSTGNGKLNILGEFDNITHAGTPPFRHMLMFFVAKVIMSAGDPDHIVFTVRVLDEDGELAAQPMTIPAQRQPMRRNHDEMETIRIMVGIVNAEFRKFGPHVFELWGNDDRLHELRLDIRQAPSA